MYRLVTISICLLAFNFSFAQNKNISNNINSALEKAKLENKQVFVNYFSLDCASSEKMKKQLKEADLQKVFNENYIVVDIEIPKEETSEYVTCSNPMKSFNDNHCEEIEFPFWYILDNSGEQTTNSFKDVNNGFSYTNENINNFIEIIKNASKLTSTRNTTYQIASK